MTDSIDRDAPGDMTKDERKRIADELAAMDEADRKRAIAERPEFEGLQVRPENIYYEELKDREPGDTNIVKWGFDLHPQVTFASAGFLILFLGLSLIFKDQAETFFQGSLDFIADKFGWFYILSANIFVIAIFAFAFSKYGKIRLGGQHARPELRFCSANRIGRNAAGHNRRARV